MLNFYGSILSMLANLRELQNTYEGHLPSSDLLSQGTKTALYGALEPYEKVCENFEMSDAYDRIQRIRRLLGHPIRECSYTEAVFQLKTLHEIVEDSLNKRLFWYISKEQAIHLSDAKDIPFKDGPDLVQARYDWYEAVWCHAFDRHTACVMHLMRLIEVGLRTLGRHLNIELKRAIEFEDWRPILEAVDDKLAQLANEPRTEERARKLEFYSDAAKEMGYFKNLWRDAGAHARGQFDKHEAARALDRVRDFMTLLAEKLDSVSE
jgi:hypothetical protein